jgi:hypothetical protein
MSLSHRWTACFAVALLAASVGFAAAPDAGSTSPWAALHHRRSAHLRAHHAQSRDDGPRSPAGEAATGDTQAMLAVVEDVVDCLRAKGFHPGDPQVQGANVVIADWDPAWDSPAGRADEECSFPVR